MEELLKLLEQRLDWAELERRGPNPSDPRGLNLQKRWAYANSRQIDGRLTYYRGLQPTEEERPQFLRVARAGDKIGPGLGRFVAGILGADPEWSLKRDDSDVTSDLLDTLSDDEDETEDAKRPSEEQINLARELNELEDQLSTWHDEAKLHAALKESYRTAIWGGFSSLRMYIPDSIAADNPQVAQRSFGTLEEALSVIYINAVDARYGGPVKDEHGNTLAHFYEYAEMGEDGREITLIELHTPRDTRTYERKLNELEERTDRYRNGVPPANPFWREGERPQFLMHTLEHPSGGLLDESIIDEQDSLNESKIEMRRNGMMGGHRQLVTINAKPPTNEEGKEVPYRTGAAIAININGYPYDAGEGKKAITQPDFKVIDPVDPMVFITAIRHHTSEILSRWDQGHFEADFLAISGESKKESRAAWESLLEFESAMPANALAWLVLSALRFAYWLTGRGDNAFDIYEVQPKLHLAVSNSDMNTVMQASELVKRDHMTLDAFVETNPLVGSNIEGEKAALKRIAEKNQVARSTVSAESEARLRQIQERYRGATE